MTNAATFTVEAGINALSVFATVNDVLEAGTGNFVGIRITSPSGVGYSTAIETPVLGRSLREINVANPEAGTWTLEVRGARSLNAAPQVSSPTQIAQPGPVDGTVSQIRYILPTISDIENHPQRTQIETAIKNRLIDTFTDGSFRPNQTVTREDLAWSLVLNTPLRQTIGNTARFNDVSGELARIAEAVTAKGSTLRGYDFTADGLISASGANFNASGAINRLDLAVAFVRALGHDAQARSLANTNVTSGGVALTDNAQIPGALRGYVQIAIDKGLFEAFPAQIIQIAPGQFQALPGPRFEPSTTVTRGTFAGKLTLFNQLFSTGG